MPGRNRERSSARSKAAPDLEEEVARIVSLTKDDLRTLWRKTKRRAPPEALSKDLMARALAQALQEARLGTLTPKLRKRLAAFADGGGDSSRHVKTGSVIVREYQGQLHEVVVVPEGFLWAGHTYRSLSTIAQKITGTTWNGPRFFGLRGRYARKDMEKRPADKQKILLQAQPAKVVGRATGRVSLGGQQSYELGKEDLYEEAGI